MRRLRLLLQLTYYDEMDNCNAGQRYSMFSAALKDLLESLAFLQWENYIAINGI